MINGELRPVSLSLFDSLARAYRQRLAAAHRELELSAAAPSGAVQEGRMRLRDDWNVPLLVSLAAQSINPPWRHRSPQTAEGVRGSPGCAHGRPSGTLPWRNISLSFLLEL